MIVKYSSLGGGCFIQVPTEYREGNEWRDSDRVFMFIGGIVFVNDYGVVKNETIGGVGYFETEIIVNKMFGWNEWTGTKVFVFV